MCGVPLQEIGVFSPPVGPTKDKLEGSTDNQAGILRADRRILSISVGIEMSFKRGKVCIDLIHTG
jgi:hypothetical protein